MAGVQLKPAGILPSNGTLQVKITDDPLIVGCPNSPDSHGDVIFTSLTVTLSSVEAQRAGALGLTGEWISIAAAPMPIDILQLKNVSQLLGSTSVSEGTITSIRLNVTSVAGVTNSGVPSIVVSSDKLQVSLHSNGEVRAGMTTAVVVDFQPHLVCEGNGTFRLTPMLSATSNGPE